jgi:hypothetical protein
MVFETVQGYQLETDYGRRFACQLLLVQAPLNYVVPVAALQRAGMFTRRSHPYGYQLFQFRRQ